MSHWPRPLLHIILRDRALMFGFVQSTADLLEHVKVILDVFKRAVVRQFA